MSEKRARDSSETESSSDLEDVDDSLVVRQDWDEEDVGTVSRDARTKRIKDRYLVVDKRRVGNVIVQGLFPLDKHIVPRAEAQRHAQEILEKRKLFLVLDVDQTLLQSIDMGTAPDQDRLEEVSDAAKHGAGGIFDFEVIRSDLDLRVNFYCKIRPFTDRLLREASKMFELTFFTKGVRPYAEKVITLLDPERKYITGCISRLECPDMFKMLHYTHGTDKTTLILDDTPYAWEGFYQNLLLVSRYHYFTREEFNVNHSDCEGVGLDKSFDVLKRIHREFFEEYDRNKHVDVRDIVKRITSTILEGCVVSIDLNWVKSRRTYQRVCNRCAMLGARVVWNKHRSITHILTTNPRPASWQRPGVIRVHPAWLTYCKIMRFRVPERWFPPQLEDPEEPFM